MLTDHVNSGGRAADSANRRWGAAWVLIFAMGHAAAAQNIRTGTEVSPDDVPAKVTRYIDVVFNEHDNDGNGQLEDAEWSQMSGDPASIDQNQDGLVTLAEFRTYVISYGQARAPILISEEANTDPVASTEPDSVTTVDATDKSGEGTPGSEHATGENTNSRETRYTVRPSRGIGTLPGWFLGRDANGDGQLTLKEFVSNGGGNRREFDRLDGNGDGLVTPREVTAPRAEAERSSP